jgi:hypothetical protein
VGTNPNNRWRAVSSLQKAIRHSYPEEARFAAAVACDMDEKYLFQRLAVIAFEDLAVGNLWLCACCLAALGSSQWRKKVGSKRLAVWLAHQMANVSKDRTLCEFQVLLGMKVGELSTKLHEGFGEPQLREVMFNTNATIADRMAALNLLPKPVLFECMLLAHAPRIILYLIQRGASRVPYNLHQGLFFVHEWLNDDEMPLQSIPLFTPPPAKVGRLLGAAYDKHTREGKTAIKLFFKQVETLNEMLKKTPEDERAGFMGNAIFRAEGAVLSPFVIYGLSADLSAFVQDPKRRWPWLSEEEAKEIYTVIRNNIPFLNKIRTDVLQKSKG